MQTRLTVSLVNVLAAQEVENTSGRQLAGPPSISLVKAKQIALNS